MALTLSAALQREFDRGASRPVWVVELYSRPDGWSDTQVNTYPIRFCWSDTPVESAPSPRAAAILREQTIIPNIVANITPLGATLEPLNRGLTQEDISIELIDDGTLRNILDQPSINNVNGAPNPNITNYLFGQKVIIKVGFQNLDISEYLTLGNFSITEVTPREAVIEIQCKSITSIPASVTVSRNFRTRSPHGQLHDIISGTVGLDNTSGTYNEDSVDAWYTNQPLNDIDKRHWAIARQDNEIDGEWMGVSKAPSGESAWELINNICSLTGGFVCEREDGKITYVPYVADASAVRNLTEEDIDQFEQEVTYANLQNEAVLEIPSTIKTTKWEPGISSSGILNIDANFGGVSGQTIYTSKIDESGQDARYPDRPSTVTNRRFIPFKKTLDWESGMSSAALLQPRVVTYGSTLVTGEVNSAGQPQGTAYYTHATRTITLNGGKLNITVKPSGSTLSDYLESDFVDVQRGPVLRVMSLTSLDGPVLDTDGNQVTYKEGRIQAIDNSGASSVMTLADDMYLEFEADWGSSVTGFHWVILEPSFPVPCQGVSYTLNHMMGLIGLRDVYLYGTPTGIATNIKNAHFSRYFYIQWSAMTGVAGANIQFSSPHEITLGAPYAAGFNTNQVGGPAHQQFRGIGYDDLRLLYGHSAYATTPTSSAQYAQLQGAERTRNLGVSGDVARFADIKLEYDTEAINSFEYIKCNLSHPLPVKWMDFTGVTPPVIISDYNIQRSARSAFEGTHEITNNPRAQTTYWSTFVYRVDCQTVTVGTVPDSRSGVPAWDNSTKRARAILPSGRGRFASLARGFRIPPSVIIASGFGVNANIGSTAGHYLGARATDVTCAVSVAERVLNRTAYGMPIVTFTTSLKHIDLQLGDFISIAHPLYLRHNKNGSDSGTIFEITRKEINLETDTPNIAWEAAFVRQDAIPSYTFANVPILEVTLFTPSFGRISRNIFDSGGNTVYAQTGSPIQAINRVPGLGTPWE